MKMNIQRADSRGGANHGWLDAKHYFSFGAYHDAKRVHFGLLRVLNDDKIAAGAGFPPHPHDNMEIVTIPLTGAIQHRDNTGGEGIIRAGDVQIMSAGSGVKHSEFNASSTDEATLFQIWVFPKQKNIQPRYDQRTFNVEQRRNEWQIVVSPIATENALWINQDARFSLAHLEANQSIEYKNGFAGNGVYLVVISGAAATGGETLNRRDAAGITGTDNFDIEALENTELLAIEIPMN